MEPGGQESAREQRAQIELKLRELGQLFHTLDPSPFRERSLDASAEVFIAEWARATPQATELELVIHLPAPPPGGELPEQLEAAVQAHFQYLAERKRSELRELLARGRTSLAIGLAFLSVCVIAGNALAQAGTSALLDLGREGLLIGGWVAMWRPIEIFLYDWWGVRRQQRRYERLGRMTVRFAGSR